MSLSVATRVAQILAALLLGLVLFLAFDAQRASAALASPPTIDPALVSVQAPQVGASVTVTIQAGAVSNVDNDTRVWAVNLSQGYASTQKKYNPNSGTSVTLQGAGGDLIGVYAENAPYGVGHTDFEELGFVPDPTDTARPDFDLALITGPAQLSGGSYHIKGAVDSIQDESFPVVAEVAGATPSSITLTNTSGTGNDNPFDFKLTGAAPGERWVLKITDNYGNWQELHFVVADQASAPSDDFVPTTQYESDYQGLAERAGHEARFGDVLLAGREFVTQQSAFPRPESLVPWDFTMHYRSGIDYDGRLGACWDWPLDARLDFVSSSTIHWYTGTGTRWTFTDGQLVTSGGFYFAYKSPAGVPLRLRFYVGSPDAEYILENRSGVRYCFSGSTGLLGRIDDAYGNSVYLTRADDGRLIEIRDEFDRRYSVSWLFQDGGVRLGGIRDFAARRTTLSYDSLGRMTTVERPDQKTNDFTYDGTSARLATITDADGYVALENNYDVNGKVQSQRTPYNLQYGGYIAFNEQTPVGGSSRETEVTVPYGTSTTTRTSTIRFGFQTSPYYTLDFVRVYSNNADRSSSAGYPGTLGDPDWWQESYEYDGFFRTTTSYLTTEGVSGVVGKREWTYETAVFSHGPLDDHREIVRVAEFKETGDGGASPSTDPHRSISWEYDDVNNPLWPTKRVDGLQNETLLTFDEGGQLLEEQLLNVEQGFFADYDIVRAYEYDSRGRPLKEWSANRNALPYGSPAPSMVYSYYSTGSDVGRLHTRTEQNASATAWMTETYSYDVYGNLTERFDAAGESWTYQHDVMGRVVSMREPSVVRTYPGASGSMQDGYDVTYLGDRVDKVVRLLDSAVDDNLSEEVVTEYEYSTYGILEASERDTEIIGAFVQTHREEYEYSQRGERVETRISGPDESGASSFVSSRVAFDSRGLLLKEVDDPGFGNSTNDGDEIVTWYQYGAFHKPTQLFRPLATGPLTITYNPYGDVSSTETSETSFGIAHDLDPVDQSMEFPAVDHRGVIREEWEYDARGLVLESRRKTRSDGTSATWLVASAERPVFNADGQLILSYVARTWNPTPPPALPATGDWDLYRFDYYPDGQLWHEMGAASTEYDTAVLDEFDRVVTRYDRVGNQTNLAYDTAGRLVERDWKPWDEVAGANIVTYRAHYNHNEVGRINELLYLGEVDGSGSPVVDTIGLRFHYDGQGRTVREEAYNFSLSELGQVRETTFTLDGLPIEVKEGMDFSTYAHHRRLVTEYDRYRRIKNRTQNPNAYEGQRVTHFVYDALGRPTEVWRPERTFAAGPRIERHSYRPNGYEVLETVDALDVKKTYGYNDLGMLLETTVNLTQAPTYVEGSEAVRFCHMFPIGTQHLISDAPAVSTTFPSSAGLSSFDTVVRRQFGPRDELLWEETQVATGCGDPRLKISFAYDAELRRERLQYPPEAATEPGTASPDVRRDYRPDGTLERVLVKNAIGNYVTFAKHEYVGKTIWRTSVFDINPNGVAEESSSDLMYYKTNFIDSREQIYRTEAVHVDQSELLIDEVVRDWHGMVIKKLQPDGNWSHVRYDGMGRMTQALWGSQTAATPNWSNIGSTPGIGTTYTSRSITLSSFGEAVAVSDYWAERGEYKSWSQAFDSAGFLDASATPVNIPGENLLDDYPGLSTHFESLTDRQHDVNDEGLTTSASYSYYRSKDCSQSSSDESLVSDVDIEYGYDAWGNLVKTRKIETYQSSSYDCIAAGVPSDKDVTAVRKRDAFGRVLYYRTTGTGDSRSVMHVYEGDAVVQAVRLDESTCIPDGRFAGRVQSTPDAAPPPAGPGSPNPPPGGGGGGGGGGPELGCDIGPLCNDSSGLPPVALFAEMYTTDRNLLGHRVLSNRDFIESRDEHYQQSDQFFVRDFAPWGTRMASDYDGYSFPGTSAEELHDFLGFDNWLVGFDSLEIPEVLYVETVLPIHAGHFLEAALNILAKLIGWLKAEQLRKEVEQKEARLADAQADAESKEDALVRKAEEDDSEEDFYSKYWESFRALATSLEAVAAAAKQVSECIEKLRELLERCPNLALAGELASLAKRHSQLNDIATSATSESRDLMGALLIPGPILSVGPGYQEAGFGGAARHLLREIAKRAQRAIGGTGRVAGTKKHRYAKRLLERYQRMYGKQGRRFEVEGSWRGGGRIHYGAKGSARIDVLDTRTNIAYDYKFTLNPPGLSLRQVRHILKNGPFGIRKVIPINP